MYSIDGLSPKGGMGGHGFCIHLSPAFRDKVALTGLEQQHVDGLIKSRGLHWLQSCGFSHYFDPENCGFEAEKHAIPSDKERPGYGHRELRVSWGEWGPEHISVPGNACGLDLERSTFGCIFDGGKVLQPHNVDSWNQVMLLLLPFTWLAHYVLAGYKVNDGES